MKPNGLKNHPIDSRQLLSFITVARTRNFTQAGKELSLSQSAVSHAVKALEDELGQSFLDRNGKKIQITPAGEHLLHYAEKILADMSVARESLEQRLRWGKSRLRLGTSGNFCAALLPKVLESLLMEFPDWPVSVKTGDTRQCVEWLDHNVIDMAIVIAPSSAEAVQMTPLFTDEVVWIVSPTHAWARGGRAVAEELAAQSYICTSTANYTSLLLKKHLERDGLSLKSSLEVNSLEAIKKIVKAGMGITAQAPWAVQAELADQSLVALPLGKRKLKRNWCLLRSPDRKPNLVQEKFAKLSLELGKVLNPLLAAATLVMNALWQAGLFDLDDLPVQI